MTSVSKFLPVNLYFDVSIITGYIRTLEIFQASDTIMYIVSKKFNFYYYSVIVIVVKYDNFIFSTKLISNGSSNSKRL